MKKLFIILAFLFTGCFETHEERVQAMANRADLIKLKTIPGTGCDLYYVANGDSTSGPVVVCPTEAATINCETQGPVLVNLT